MNEAETRADHIDPALKAAGRADRTSDGPIRPRSGLGYRPPAPEAWLAPCVRLAYASANALG